MTLTALYYGNLMNFLLIQENRISMLVFNNILIYLYFIEIMVHFFNEKCGRISCKKH